MARPVGSVLQFRVENSRLKLIVDYSKVVNSGLIVNYNLDVDYESDVSSIATVNYEFAVYRSFKVLRTSPPASLLVKLTPSGRLSSYE